MTKFKKVILLIVVTLLMVSCVSVVKATAGDLLVVNQSNIPSTTDILNATDNITTTPGNNTNNTTTIGNTSRNTSTYNNTSNLPKTGAEDYALTLIIGGVAVIAILTYRRMKYYKGI